MNSNRILRYGVMFGAAAIITVTVGHMVGRSQGLAVGEADKARLQLIWPSLMSMPKDDRALLVGLAMTCNLQRTPLDASDVADCLRKGVDDSNVMLPKGIERDQARSRLEVLLHEKSV
ncbi:hypothetical protein PPH41_04555 [Burkholderia gladioli]|nr:hypothetical protein [Burkholderia gladioli]